jgi:hypothetical protein
LSHDADHSLICPFLDESPAYAAGVELGVLFERMKRRRVIRDYFTAANQDQITLLCNRTGWEVVSMRPWGGEGQWFYGVLRRKERGLRVG